MKTEIPTIATNVYVSSRQGEFHPKPLTELYVIVSHHTALLIQLLLLVGVSNVPVVK